MSKIDIKVYEDNILVEERFEKVVKKVFVPGDAGVKDGSYVVGKKKILKVGPGAEHLDIKGDIVFKEWAEPFYSAVVEGTTDSAVIIKHSVYNCDMVACTITETE